MTQFKGRDTTASGKERRSRFAVWAERLSASNLLVTFAVFTGLTSAQSAEPVDSISAGGAAETSPLDIVFDDPSEAANNLAELNAWSDTLATGRSEPLTFSVGDVWLSGTWVIPHSQGGQISGAGVVQDVFGEDETSAKNKSHTTRLLFVEEVEENVFEGLPLGIQYDGAGLNLGGLSIWGYANNSRKGFANNVDDHNGGVGILVTEYETGKQWGPGKLRIPDLSLVG